MTIAVVGCSNTGMSVARAAGDFYVASFSGGTVHAWATANAKSAAGWSEFDNHPTIGAVWFQLCEHVATAALYDEAAAVVEMIKARTSAPIFVSGLNGYNPPRDNWAKGAIATIATNAAAAQLASAGRAHLGPNMASVALTPAECVKNGTSPHPKKAGQIRLAAVIDAFNFSA